MGQTIYTSSVNRAGLIVWAGVSTALPTAMLLWLMLGNAPLQAESPTGLIISRSGDHINVNLDSQASSDVSIRRSDDVMIIKVPSSFNAKMVIDPRLQRDRVVQETEIPSGKVITINSQQIYLMTQENLKDNTGTPSKPVAAGARPSEKNQGSGLHAAVDQPAAQPAVESGIKPVALTETDKAQGQTQAVKTEKARKKSAEALSISGIPSIVPHEKPAHPSLKTQPKASTKAKPKTNPASAAKPSSTESAAADGRDPFNGADPEAQPLDLSGRQQESANRVASYTLFRIVLSLLAVLGMLLGFVRVLLPKLMERYPAFFERLRQRHERKMQEPHQTTARRRGPFFDGPAAKQAAAMPEPVIKPETPLVEPATVPVHVQPDSAARATDALQLFQESQLTVLGSTPLGDGKEIHLVEVQGKQLVIATTPSTVSFLTDLSNTTLADDDQDDDVQLADANPPLSLPSEASEPPNVIAYLSDESPLLADPTDPVSPPEPPNKPYASTPKAAQSPAVSPPPGAPAKPSQPEVAIDKTYRKYLQPKKRPSASQPPYVDAEEVIVLEDYDDIYGF